MTAEHYDMPMDFVDLKKCGNRLGTAAIMVFDQNSCLVGATLNLMEFFARESCGWCTPCRDGLPYVEHLLAAIDDGAIPASARRRLTARTGSPGRGTMPR